MKPFPRILLLLTLLTLAPVCTRAGDAEAVAQALAMLGPHPGSQAILIRNPRRGGGFPARVHAAVFSFHGVLWLYVPGQGTQSLSHRRGRLDLDRANLLPLLQEIHPGFTGYEVVAAPAASARPRVFPKLRNGCFVESLHALTRLLDEGAAPTDAGLLTYYVSSPRGLRGHTGLFYRTPRGMFFWDPDHPTEPRKLDGSGNDLDRLAREVSFGGPGHIVRTHFLPIDGDPRRPAWDRPVVQHSDEGPGSADLGTG